MTLVGCLLFIPALSAALPDASATRDAHEEIIVLGKLSSLGSTEKTVQATESVLVSEFRRLLGSRLRTMEALHALDPSVSSSIDACGSDSGCLLEIVGGVGWDGLIIGNLAGLGEERIITLRHLSARTGELLGSRAVSASGDEAELITQIRGAAVQLVAPSRYVGAVEIKVRQPGVQIAIDGALVGSSPLARNRFPLAVGRHAIEATGNGLEPRSEMLDIRYGETRIVDIDLPANSIYVGGTAPYYVRWWTWAIAGAGAAGLGVGGFFDNRQSSTVSNIEARAELGTLTGDDAGLYQDADDHRERALLFYGVGGALSLTAATLLALDLL